MNRETILQKLRDEAKSWFVSECNLYGGWRVIKHFDTHEFVVCHTMHNPITREDWEGVTHDPVHKPNHYQMIDGVESIQVIACSLTREEWRGFCLGNELKYRMRAGKKDALQQDIDKANEYGLLFEKYKELNRVKR